MSVFDALVESDEAEAARLAKYPEGTDTHKLAALPVTFRGNPRGLIIALPEEAIGMRLTVVPFQSMVRRSVEDGPMLHDADWTCFVVASDYPRYRPGGTPIVVSESEIRRGREIVLDPGDGRGL